MADSILTINAEIGNHHSNSLFFHSRGLATMGNGQVRGMGTASRLKTRRAGNAVHADARPIGDHAQAMAAVLAIPGRAVRSSKGHRDRPPGSAMAGSISLLPP